MLIQLMPLILLFAFSFLSSLPSLFSTPAVPDPRFAFTPSARFTAERSTADHHIKYYVNPQEMQNHAGIAADLAAAAVVAGSTSSSGNGNSVRNLKELRRFENKVEETYANELYYDCRRQTERKERKKEQEIGIFGIGTDWEKVRKIQQEVIESCEELKKLGVRF
jgi:DnaJ homolog subfamily B member 12